MAGETTRVYIPFSAKGDDESRTVVGYASGNGNVDLDQQIVDPAWLNGELPTWLASFGNIREQHRPDSAVGKAKAVDVTDPNGPLLTTKIVDDAAWRKVKEGVYNGFSVGIKSPKIIFDGAAKNGRIVGGKLIEVSIVDRPANDAAKFTLVKAAGPNLWKVGDQGAVVEDTAKAALAADVAKCDLDGCDCTCGPDGADPDCDCQCPVCQAARDADGDDDGDKAAQPEAGKRAFSDARRKELADAGAARPDGSYPIERPVDVENAVRDFSRSNGSDADKAHIVARAKAIGATDKLPADWQGSSKGKEKAVAEQAQQPVTPDAAKAAASHVEHKHPYKGVHNHEHDDGAGDTHTHAHMHDDDDLHDHPHLGGKDARMLSPEDRDAAIALRRNADSVYFTASGTAGAPAADTAKSTNDVNTVNVAPGTPRAPSKIGNELEAILADAKARIEALAGQTDEDRDGDVDTAANMAAGEKRDAPNAQEERPAPTLIRPETLSLSFASEADLTKFIDARVNARLAEQPEFLTKAAGAESLATIPDIAKLAGGLAKGLEALASKAATAAEELATVKGTLAETQADLGKVKELAQPVKGSVFAVDKGIGLEPDRINPDGTSKTARPARGSVEWLAKEVATLSEDEKVELARSAYRQFAPGNR